MEQISQKNPVSFEHPLKGGTRLRTGIGKTALDALDRILHRGESASALPITQEEMEDTLHEAIQSALASHLSHQIGGGFIGENGQETGRFVIGFDESDTAYRPWLKHVCAKIGRRDQRPMSQEIRIHQAVEERMRQRSIEDIFIPIPIVCMEHVSEQEDAFVMERLPSNHANGTLQTMMNNYRNKGLIFLLSDAVREKILFGIESFHECGLLHGDLKDNLGNIYLKTTQTMLATPAKGKPLLYLYDVDMVGFLDLERAVVLDHPAKARDQQRLEAKYLMASLPPSVDADPDDPASLIDAYASSKTRKL